METADSELFNKEVPLMPASCELAYHTVNCSALNAEELRRLPILIGPRLQTEGTYRFNLVGSFLRSSVTDYLGNRLIKFSEIRYVDAS